MSRGVKMPLICCLQDVGISQLRRPQENYFQLFSFPPRRRFLVFFAINKIKFSIPVRKLEARKAIRNSAEIYLRFFTPEFKIEVKMRYGSEKSAVFHFGKLVFI